MKKLGYLFCLILFFLGIVVPLVRSEEKNEPVLTQAQRKWLDEVTWIISDYEKGAFYSLKTDQERDQFIQAFWDHRDPTPGTKKNEYQEEFYVRFEYANKQFGRESSLPGWKTDRGRIYILMGKPEFKRSVPGSFELHPMELWQYSGDRGYGIPTSLYLMFFQKDGFGPYILYSPLNDGIRDLFVARTEVTQSTDEELYDGLRYSTDPEIAHAAYSSLPTVGGDPTMSSGSLTTEVIQAKIANARNYQANKRTYVDAFLKQRPSVQVYYTVGGQGMQDGMYWFQAENGYFYLDYAIEYLPNKLDMGQYDEEYYTSLTIDGQITTPAKEEVDQIVGTHEIKLTKEKFNQVRNLSFQYQGRRPIVAGEFDITMIVTNNVSRTAATFTRDINIPDMSKATTPYIPPVLPVRSVENLPEKSDGRIRPFQYGDKVYIPNVPAKVALNGTLIVYHQVIFPEKWKEETGQLALHYIIRNGEKVETDLTEGLYMPMSDLRGNAIEIRKDLSLAGLLFGSKQLTVELRQDDKVISQSKPLLFSIDTELNQNIWKFSIAIPGYESTSHNLILAQDYMRLKQPQQASALLQEALRQNPNSPELIVPLMKIELQSRQYQKVIDLGTPAEVKDPRNQELLWLIGWANYGLGKYEDAIPFFERIRIEDPKKIEVLNILADTYYHMDERAKSLEIVQQSLAIKPDQKDILELKKKLESQQ